MRSPGEGNGAELPWWASEGRRGTKRTPLPLQCTKTSSEHAQGSHKQNRGRREGEREGGEGRGEGVTGFITLELCLKKKFTT